MNIKRNKLTEHSKKINAHLPNLPQSLRRERTPPPLGPAHMCRGLVDRVRDRSNHLKLYWLYFNFIETPRSNLYCKRESSLHKREKTRDKRYFCWLLIMVSSAHTLPLLLTTFSSLRDKNKCDLHKEVELGTSDHGVLAKCMLVGQVLGDDGV